MRCRMLMAKLDFLKHVISRGADDLCGRVVLSPCDNFQIDSSCLVRECRELEDGALLGQTSHETLSAERQ